FGDDDIKGRCISIQIQAVKEKLPAASDKVPLYLHLGALFSEKGMLDEAVRNFSVGLRLDPGNRYAYYNMGNVLKKQGRIAEAVEHYSGAVRISPNYTDALNNLAWILATDRDSGLRNGDRAVRLAEHACDISNNKDPFLLDTLAAAYAETGSFKKARNTAQKAVELAQATGYQGLAGDIEKRLKLYRSSLPFHREK
ncbi:MAG: tetratricopeptide repeat protein, partial [Deltaproteobacteria bacterium]|nr:tetratricopeptide repeat protein [Deltaproteobacteria bacterium]